MIIKTEYNSLEEMLLNSSKLNSSFELKNKNLDKDKKDKKCNQDIIGQKFGHLTVIKRVEDMIHPGGGHSAQYLCECDCENHTKIIIRKERLVKGKKTHCGCQGVQGMKVDLIGKKFGRLTPKKRLSRNKAGVGALWECDCDCGGQVICSTTELIHGKRTSCGCEIKERKKEERQIKHEEMIQKVKDKYIGKKFGHLIVEDYIGDNGGTPANFCCFFNCKCDCGSNKKKKFSLNSLRKIEAGEYKGILACKECAWKYFTTDNPNKYILDGEYGIGFADGYDKNDNPDVIEFYFDLEDYDKIKRFRWTGNKLGYIVTVVKDKTIWLHNIVTENMKGEKIIDHANRKPWDNRKENLRLVTSRENNQNRGLRKDNTSKVTGVSWIKHLKKWRVDVTCDGFRHYYGLFENYEEAVRQRLIGETEWFDKGFEPQRELFEKYRIVRGVSKGRKEIIRQGKQVAKREEVREKGIKIFLK